MPPHAGLRLVQAGLVRAPGVLMVVAALLVSCSNDEDARTQTAVEASTSTSAEPLPTTSTTAGTTGGNCPHRPAGSSTANFDPTSGTYAAQDVSIDVHSLSLTFNVVQWLSGDDARRAWTNDHPEGPDGPPNDYYIVDESDRLRTAPIRPELEVFLTHLRSDGTAGVEPDTVDGLKRYLDEGQAGDTFWLKFDGGVIVHVCEQYRP